MTSIRYAQVAGGLVGGVGAHLRKGISRGDARREFGELPERGESAPAVVGESRLEEPLG